MDMREESTEATVITSPAEASAITAANAARVQCICQELANGESCECVVPMTREQVGRLRAYLSLHPERDVIYSELAGEWMAALADFLPPGEDKDDRILAWLCDPHGLVSGADLQSSVDLDELLSLLEAPSAAVLS